MTQLSSAAKDEKRADQLDDHVARDDRMLGMLLRLTERLSAVEARVGMDAKPEISPGLSVKAAAHASGFSQSAIRKMVKQGKLADTWLGGRLFISGLPARRKCT